jgi:hypothetical protein
MYGLYSFVLQTNQEKAAANRVESLPSLETQPYMIAVNSKRGEIEQEMAVVSAKQVLQPWCWCQISGPKERVKLYWIWKRCISLRAHQTSGSALACSKEAQFATSPSLFLLVVPLRRSWQILMDSHGPGALHSWYVCTYGIVQPRYTPDIAQSMYVWPPRVLQHVLRVSFSRPICIFARTGPRTAGCHARGEQAECA